MDDITAYLHESIEDDYLTRKEKRSLKALIAKNNLDQHQMNVLRSRIFDLAAEKINDSNYSFILQWLEEANKALVAPVEKRESDVLFSPGAECRNAIIRLIRGARKQLLVCVFTISDNEISRE
ncbi:MAG: nuclease, partial [Bacteroidota bacterium]